ncbi:MAG: hypothetical protein P4L43_13980 [Syntrophobacteraceae bacterium]|nr:hypothetical protein [Syntrophobacteraceae bacterium]
MKKAKQRNLYEEKSDPVGSLDMQLDEDDDDIIELEDIIEMPDRPIDEDEDLDLGVEIFDVDEELESAPARSAQKPSVGPAKQSGLKAEEDDLLDSFEVDGDEDEEDLLFEPAPSAPKGKPSSQKGQPSELFDEEDLLFDPTESAPKGKPSSQKGQPSELFDEEDLLFDPTESAPQGKPSSQKGQPSELFDEEDLLFDLTESAPEGEPSAQKAQPSQLFATKDESSDDSILDQSFLDDLLAEAAEDEAPPGEEKVDFRARAEAALQAVEEKRPPEAAAPSSQPDPLVNVAGPSLSEISEAVEELIGRIESRLQEHIRAVVESMLPGLVRSIIDEEIEKLKKEFE